jgi:hypothetical protein
MAKEQANNVRLNERDHSVLQLLDRTPLTTALVLKASRTFADGPFRDERRTRERLLTLAKASLVRRWPLSIRGGGSTNYYKLTREGFRVVHGQDIPLPHNRFFAPTPISRLQHTQILAEVIVHTLVAAHEHRIAITRFYRENSLTLKAGGFEQQPDCTIGCRSSGRRANILFEIDRSTESVDAPVQSSIRRKIGGYEAYQDYVLGVWRQAGRRGPRPAFRVVFLTRSVERAYHILLLAREMAANKDRRLCYCATQDQYLAEADALREPLFLDHHGQWQAVFNPHPTAPFAKPSVRLPSLLPSEALF